jgi:hypothetical protein
VDSVPDIERSRVVSGLAGRLVSCWDRLEDAVSELVALHGVPEAEILERVRLTVVEELDPEEISPAATKV